MACDDELKRRVEKAKLAEQVRTFWMGEKIVHSLRRCGVEQPLHCYSMRTITLFFGASLFFASLSMAEEARISDAFRRSQVRPVQFQSMLDPEKPSWTQRVSDQWGKAGAAITNAVTPKTKRAHDPVRLSSKPAPLDASLYISMAQIYENQGRIGQATQEYEKALRLEPNNLKALVSYARMHDRATEFEQAATLYQRAIKAHPRNPIVFNDLGLCYARQSKVELSIQNLRMAVRFEPSSVRYRNNLATVLVEGGHFDEALSHMTKVHGEAIAHYNLGYLCKHRGDDEIARRHLRQALAISPSLHQARALLVELGSAPPNSRPLVQHSSSSIQRPSNPSEQLPPMRQPLPREAVRPGTSGLKRIPPTPTANAQPSSSGDRLGSLPQRRDDGRYRQESYQPVRLPQNVLRK